jgi:hypothetical protein
MAHRGRRNADEVLALAVASGQTLRDAARATGVSERTAARCWAEPDFRRRVNALREDMTSAALGRLAHTMAAAADTLARLLSAETDGVKLAAARSILQLGVDLRVSVELEERMREIEESLANVERPRTWHGSGS